MPIHRRMGKSIGVLLHTSILSSNEKETLTATDKNLDESQKYNIQFVIVL